MSFNQKHIPNLRGKKPGTLIHLGAGRCRELDTWLQAGFREIVLVEPDQVRAAELLSRVSDHDHVRVVESAVSATDGETELNVLNYPDANSLRKPERLLELFPGIRIRKRVPTHAIGIETLLSEFELSADAVNGLVIETPGEEHAIVKALLEADAIYSLAFVTLQAPTVPLYAGARPLTSIESLLQDAGFALEGSHDAGEDPIRPVRQFERDLAALERKRLSQELAKAKKDREALKRKLKQAEEDSESSQKELKETKQKLSELQAELRDTKSAADQLETVRKELAERDKAVESLKVERDEVLSEKKSLEAKLQKLSVLPDELKKAEAENEKLRNQDAERESKAAELKKVWEERSKLKRKLEEAESKAADAGTRSERLERKLDEVRTENKRLSDQLATQPAMGEEIKRLFSEQAEKLDQTVKLQKETSEALQGKFLNKILSRVDNSAKQVESYIQLNSFFDRGELLPDLHGWPISPDLAVYLMRTIKQDDYDLIIEFGSGSSTVLMAQAIAQKLLGRPMKEIQGRVSELLLEGPQVYRGADGAGREVLSSSGHSTANGSDIAPRLIAFEHMREYFDKTQQALNNAGVRDLVELAYTPLQDYQHMDGEQYLYYQCDSHLESLSSRLVADQPRILVLVDGPPGKTGPNARFPAMPVVMRYFSSARVDFVLDDSNRTEEKKVLQAWQIEAEKRGYKADTKHLPFEKGATILELR